MRRLPTANKIRQDHLERCAYVYVRQSTLNQIRENTISTQRQYELGDLAAELGWGREKIVIVDQDQGRSGASVEGRDGFKRMLSEIALGNVGAVISLEASRLARDSSAWHQLLKFCDITNTLIIDERGAYDPQDPDDRLVLGLKGTLSEAENSLIRARLMEAKRRKAEDGSLVLPLPVGFNRDAEGRVVLEPDEAVQNILRVFFAAFDRLPSVKMVVREFNEKGLLFPTQPFGQARIRVLKWVPLRYNRALNILRNPVYTGAYVYGRTRRCKHIDPERGVETVRRVKYVDVDEWDVFIPNHHESYITWEKYRDNLKRIQDNRNRRNNANRGAPRSGAALLQGLLLCGICGRRIQVGYAKGRRNPSYFCCSKSVEYGGSKYCLRFQGASVDVAVAGLFLDVLKPTYLKLSIAAVERLEGEMQQVSRQWQLRLEASRHEAELARRRYEAIDPENRLVARNLERDWNAKLAEVECLVREMGEATSSPRQRLTSAQREAVEGLANDLPSIWGAETTTQVERKQLLRFLIKDITAMRAGRVVTLNVRWQTGACTRLDVQLKSRADTARTHQDTVGRIRELAGSGHGDPEIAEELNEAGVLSKKGLRFNSHVVAAIRHHHGIKAAWPKHYVYRPPKDGRVGPKVIAEALGVCSSAVIKWCQKGLLDAVQAEKGRYWWVEWTPEAMNRLKALKPKIFAQ